MMYASKITLDYNPKKVRVERKIDLGHEDTLSIPELRKLGVKDDNNFSIYEHEITRHTMLYVTGYRMETKQEVKERVKKELSYNKSYEEFHSRIKRDKVIISDKANNQ